MGDWAQDDTGAWTRTLYGLLLRVRLQKGHPLDGNGWPRFSQGLCKRPKKRPPPIKRIECHSPKHVGPEAYGTPIPCLSAHPR